MHVYFQYVSLHVLLCFSLHVYFVGLLGHFFSCFVFLNSRFSDSDAKRCSQCRKLWSIEGDGHSLYPGCRECSKKHPCDVCRSWSTRLWNSLKKRAEERGKSVSKKKKSSEEAPSEEIVVGAIPQIDNQENVFVGAIPHDTEQAPHEDDAAVLQTRSSTTPTPLPDAIQAGVSPEQQGTIQQGAIQAGFNPSQTIFSVASEGVQPSVPGSACFVNTAGIGRGLSASVIPEAHFAQGASVHRGQGFQTFFIPGGFPGGQSIQAGPASFWRAPLSASEGTVSNPSESVQPSASGAPGTSGVQERGRSRSRSRQKKKRRHRSSSSSSFSGSSDSSRHRSHRRRKRHLPSDSLAQLVALLSKPTAQQQSVEQLDSQRDVSQESHLASRLHPAPQVSPVSGDQEWEESDSRERDRSRSRSPSLIDISGHSGSESGSDNDQPLLGTEITKEAFDKAVEVIRRQLGFEDSSPSQEPSVSKSKLTLNQPSKPRLSSMPVDVECLERFEATSKLSPWKPYPKRQSLSFRMGDKDWEEFFKTPKIPVAASEKLKSTGAMDQSGKLKSESSRKTFSGFFGIDLAARTGMKFASSLLLIAEVLSKAFRRGAGEVSKRDTAALVNLLGPVSRLTYDQLARIAVKSEFERRRVILDAIRWPSKDIKRRFLELPFSGPDLFAGKFEEQLLREVKMQKDIKKADFRLRSSEGSSQRRFQSSSYSSSRRPSRSSGQSSSVRSRRQGRDRDRPPSTRGSFQRSYNSGRQSSRGSLRGGSRSSRGGFQTKP